MLAIPSFHLMQNFVSSKQTFDAVKCVQCRRCVIVLFAVTKMKQVQLVMEMKLWPRVFCNLADWRAKFKTMKFQDIFKIKHFHHFTFSSMSKGSVARQTTWLMKLCK